MIYGGTTSCFQGSLAVTFFCGLFSGGGSQNTRLRVGEIRHKKLPHAKKCHNTERVFTMKLPPRRHIFLAKMNVLPTIHKSIAEIIYVNQRFPGIALEQSSGRCSELVPQSFRMDKFRFRGFERAIFLSFSDTKY